MKDICFTKRKISANKKCFDHKEKNFTNCCYMIISYIFFTINYCVTRILNEIKKYNNEQTVDILKGHNFADCWVGTNIYNLNIIVSKLDDKKRERILKVSPDKESRRVMIHPLKITLNDVTFTSKELEIGCRNMPDSNIITKVKKII